MSALGLLVIAGLIAVATFNVATAVLAWPGLVIVNAVCSRFGIYLQEFPTWAWLIPSLLLDLLFYTLLFFACAKLWRTLKSDGKQRLGNEVLSTTNDRRPTMQP